MEYDYEKDEDYCEECKEENERKRRGRGMTKGDAMLRRAIVRKGRALKCGWLLSRSLGRLRFAFARMQALLQIKVMYLHMSTSLAVRNEGGFAVNSL